MKVGDKIVLNEKFGGYYTKEGKSYHAWDEIGLYKEGDILTVSHVYNEDLVYASVEGTHPYIVVEEDGGFDGYFKDYATLLATDEYEIVKSDDPRIVDSGSDISMDVLPDCKLKKFLQYEHNL